MKRLKKFTIILLLSLVFLILAYEIYAGVYGNFHKIDKNAYRSAMLNDLNLAYYLKKHKIKTIVNLHNPKGDWYKKEIKTAKIYGTKHITFVLTSDGYYDFDKVEKIVEILRTAEKPILIHCVGGADRTSLVSALYEYAINGKSKEESEKQLSWYYGHLPFINAKVKAMDRTFDNFVKINKQNQ